LVSTGKSSLQVVDVLKNAGLNVDGMVSIFNYGFPEAKNAFEKYQLTLKSLTDYDSLIALAIQQNKISEEDQKALLNWRHDPSNWKVNS
jgi:orotate phosphoribosyltransferase